MNCRPLADILEFPTGQDCLKPSTDIVSWQPASKPASFWGHFPAVACLGVIGCGILLPEAEGHGSPGTVATEVQTKNTAVLIGKQGSEFRALGSWSVAQIWGLPRLDIAQPVPAGPGCCGPSWVGPGSIAFLAGSWLCSEPNIPLFPLVSAAGKVLQKECFLFSLKLKKNGFKIVHTCTGIRA